MMSDAFAGRTVLVTGGGAGIGRSIVSAFSRAGAAVAVCDVVRDTAEDVAAELKTGGGRAGAWAVDVSDAGQVKAVVDAVLADLGSLDILVNNAGITRDNLLLRMSDEEFDRVVAVNLRGAFNCIRACCRPMMKARWGRIVNISSVIGQMGNAGQANYAAAKAGLIGLTKSAARELAGRGITVNAVAPGFITTAMTEKLDPAVREAYVASIPLKRAGTPEDVAGTCLFLASDAAQYITGQVIRVDGGMLM
jgi:3-oxoacyl-[acyl-carrier protein] reductase